MIDLITVLGQMLTPEQQILDQLNQAIELRRDSKSWHDEILIGLFVCYGLSFLVGVNALLSLVFYRGPRLSPKDKERTEWPLVSVLIPARNERDRLGPCLDSFLVQDYPNLEILVLDDDSTDGTDALVKEFVAKDPRFRLVQGKPLDPGWTGKNWACHQLAHQARGDFYLFTDADTEHHPQAVKTVVSEMEREGLDLVSLWPLQLLNSLLERLVIPLVPVVMLALRPHWLERVLRWSVLGAANGQFLMFRRSAYQHVRGHAAVKANLIEDVALARLCLGKGLKAENRDGGDFVVCRMYRNGRELWEGFTKNIRPAFGRAWWMFWLFGLVVVVTLLLPFAAVGLLGYRPLVDGGMFAVALCTWTWFWRLMVAGRAEGSLVGVLLHPIAVIVALALALNSMWRHALGGVTWKGRKYSGR